MSDKNGNAEANLDDEARRAGQAYLASFGGDLRAACADLRHRARTEGRTVITGAAKPPEPWHFRRNPPERRAAV
ncbi:MAG TPA: hypothetical protein VK324_02480 [Tepidisphaeraceae bacterium]|nr:hypothetical protein [Tepidisphaeraceae bacterium]